MLLKIHFQVHSVKVLIKKKKKKMKHFDREFSWKIYHDGELVHDAW